MSISICKDNQKNSKVINILVKGLGQVPICDQCAEQLIKNKKMICKNCPSTANYLLNTKLGYEPICDQCAKTDDSAVMNLLVTHKYGEAVICNKYMKYIDDLKPNQYDVMGLIDVVPLEHSYFIENHENPESQHYFMDFKNYYIPPENDPDWNDGLESENDPDWNDGLESDDELDFNVTKHQTNLNVKY